MLSRIPGPPRKYVTHLGPPNFSRPSTKNPGQKSSVQILSQLFAEVFVRGFCRVSFCPFPLLSQYICYNRKLNITLNFMFHMYDKNLYKRDVTCSLPPSPCHKLSHFFGSPPPLERDVLYGRPLIYSSLCRWRYA